VICGTTRDRCGNLSRSGTGSTFMDLRRVEWVRLRKKPGAMKRIFRA
jgi:hypothetical protein